MLDGNYISCAVPDFILDVKQGDKISLIADSTISGTVRTGVENTWLNVEIVV